MHMRSMAARLPLEVTADGSVVLMVFREVENAMANGQSLAQRLPLNESQVQDRSEAVRIATP